MRITITGLHLQNFQNIGSIDIDFNGKDTVITGHNGSGKTTVANAISWLLFATASDRTRSFSPKTVGADGQPVHNLHHIAEATFERDGVPFTLKKDYHEVWTVRRGVLDANGNRKKEFAGHETDYFIDGRQVKCEEYDRWLSSLFSADDARILTLPLHFALDLDVRTRREKVQSLVGDVPREDILAEDPSLADILDMADDKGGVDNLADDLRQDAKNLDSQLKSIPVRISECEQAIRPMDDDLEGTIAAIAAIQDEIAGLKERCSGITDTAATATLRDRLTDLTSRQNAIRRKVDDRNGDELSAWRRTCDAHRTACARIEQELTVAKGRVRMGEDDISRFKASRDELTGRIEKIRNTAFTEPLPSRLCPCCGQDLPIERMDEAMAAHEARRTAFEEERSRRLQDAMARMTATCSDSRLQQLEQELSDARAKAEALSGQLEDERKALAEAEAARPLTARVDDEEGYADLMDDIARTRAALADADRAKEAATKDIREKIAALQEEAAQKDKVKVQLEINSRMKDRIAQLNREHAHLLDRNADVKDDLEAIDRLNRTRARLFEKRQLEAFGNGVYFSFFTDQVNGGLKDTCEPMVVTADGRRIPFTKASTSEQINGGLRIIEAFSRHMDLSLPIIIDNAEAVNEVLKTSAQRILLRVGTGALEAHNIG